MAANKSQEADATRELMKDMMIVQLGLAGIGQREIRAIVGCSIDRVNGIVKHLRPKKTTGENSNGAKGRRK